MTDFEIDILIEDLRWSTELHSIEALVSQGIHGAITQLKQSGVTPKAFTEVSLAFVDDEKIQRLNSQYRHKDKPTNVLSFPGSEIDGFCPMLGDIVLGYETVHKEAKERHILLDNHVTHLVIHGFLHLQGYDHESDAEAQAMEALEIRTLKGLGIANPYDKEDGS